MITLAPLLKMILIPFSYSCDLWGKGEKWEEDGWGAQAERGGQNEDVELSVLDGA